MRLSTSWPDNVGRVVLQTTDSTNAEAARRAPSLAGPHWILALEQTAARGRRGRPWLNPKGNFAATYLMQPNETPDQVALRSFVASLALFDAFVATTGRTDGLALKWPNDVLLNGGKVAGILLESIGSGSGVGHLAIGIGVNLATAPDASAVEQGAVQPVSLAQETGVLVSPEQFLETLAPAYARWESSFVTYGFGPIRQAWMLRAARLGQPITARTAADTVAGTFETVDDAGNLVVSTPKGRVSIAAAEVFF